MNRALPISTSQFVEEVCKVFDELKETFKAKNEQYGTCDPLANFRTGALLHRGNDSYDDMYEEAKDYQRKHIAHVENWGIEGPKVNESLTDIAVYAVIMRVMQQHWQNEK